jgi:hypothetical protein
MTHTDETKLGESQTSQSGVSLLLAVLVLAAITAVAFSLATIVFIEIRSSGDAKRTEPALYATFGVTEEALFQYKRFYTPVSKGDFNVPTCDGPKYSDVCLINNVTLTLPGTQPLSFDNNPRVEYVAESSTISIPMYIAGDYSQQYSQIQIQVLPNSNLTAVTASFNITFQDNSTTSVTPFPVSPGQPNTFTQFLPSGQYELIIQNQDPYNPVYVSLVTTRVSGQEPSGLPFVGEQVLRIVADYLGLTRTYQVKIPIP